MIQPFLGLAGGGSVTAGDLRFFSLGAAFFAGCLRGEAACSSGSSANLVEAFAAVSRLRLPSAGKMTASLSGKVEAEPDA